MTEERRREEKLKKHIEYIVCDMNKVWLDLADIKSSLFILSQNMKTLKDTIEERPGNDN